MEVQTIQQRFYEMEKKGKVDESIIEDLESLEESLSSKAERIRSDLDRTGNFKLFFMVKTQIDILEEMKDRVSHAKERGDNPQVAVDSMDVLDELQNFEDISRENVKEKDFKEILELQTTARDNNLFPSSEDRKQEITPDDVESANRFFDNVRSNFGG